MGTSEEIELAKTIEAGREAEKALAVPEEIDPHKRQELGQVIRLGHQARDRLLVANLGLVTSAVERLCKTESLQDDLFQEGSIGLLKAIEKFDWRRGVRFSSYAFFWVNQAISRVLPDLISPVRIPEYLRLELNRVDAIQESLAQSGERYVDLNTLADSCGVSLERLVQLQRLKYMAIVSSGIGQSYSDSDVTDISAVEMFELVESEAHTRSHLVSSLTETERHVLFLRIGLDRGVARTLEEVGDVFGITRERVRQIEARAMSKLRSGLRGTSEGHVDPRRLLDY